MSTVTTTALMTVGIFVLIFGFIALMRYKIDSEKGFDHFDERQIVGRGQSYKIAFFAVLIYMAVYACIDAAGFRWCETSVGLSIGIFLGGTVFAVNAIVRDVFEGIRKRAGSMIIVWVIIILAQLVGFAGEWADGNLIENGILQSGFSNLACAVCFTIIVIAYLVHNKISALPEED